MSSDDRPPSDSKPRSDDSRCPDGTVHFMPGTPLALAHREDGSTGLGIAFPVRDGVPIPSGPDCILIERDRDRGRILYDPRAPVDPRAPMGSGSIGPAKVTSPAFRDGWERTFGGGGKAGAN